MKRQSSGQVRSELTNINLAEMKLAALADRELPAILHALPELAPAARPPARRYTQEDIQRSHAAKTAKYAEIRRDASNGMPGRSIERQHHDGRRTIVQALASADPPERKKIHREPAALEGLHAHIDTMIEADPEIAIAVIGEDRNVTAWVSHGPGWPAQDRPSGVGEDRNSNSPGWEPYPELSSTGPPVRTATRTSRPAS